MAQQPAHLNAWHAPSGIIYFRSPQGLACLFPAGRREAPPPAEVRKAHELFGVQVGVVPLIALIPAAIALASIAADKGWFDVDPAKAARRQSRRQQRRAQKQAQRAADFAALQEVDNDADGVGGYY